MTAVTGRRLLRPLVDMTGEGSVARFGPDNARYTMCLRPGDDGPLQRDTGVTWRPFTETLADLIDWMGSRPT